MKEDIIQRLNVTLGALNNISVSGKANLANLSGSIVMIEEIGQMLNDAEIIQEPKDTEQTKE